MIGLVERLVDDVASDLISCTHRSSRETAASVRSYCLLARKHKQTLGGNKHVKQGDTDPGESNVWERGFVFQLHCFHRRTLAALVCVCVLNNPKSVNI